MKKVFVMITMDVEPVKMNPIWTGPEDLAESERAIRAYWELGQKSGFPISFFVHPEIARPHQELFRKLEGEGACLGLHIHAMKYRYPFWKYEFGYYSADEQKNILSEGREEWFKALGKYPRYFRPGAFSANDATFPVLAEMGFTGGSLSVPGRIWPERYCVWAGAEPDPHRAHRAFRQVRGDLEFANIPLSVNFKMPMHVRGTFYYQDLRPTARGVSTEQVLKDIIARLAEGQPAVPVIHLVAHNDQPFEDAASESRRRLELALQSIGRLCREQDLVPVGATVEDVVSQVLRQPLIASPEWKQSNDVEA